MAPSVKHAAKNNSKDVTCRFIMIGYEISPISVIMEKSLLM
jgi:hypothetical protein